MWSKLLPLECSVWSLVKSYSKYLLLWAMHRHSNVYMVGRKFCNFGGDERPTFALMRMWWECLERKLGFPEMSPLGIHLPATPTFTTPTPTPPPTTQIVLWYVRVPIDISRKTTSKFSQNFKKLILNNLKDSPRNRNKNLEIFYCKVDGEKFYGTS